jgi:hypothetical protein
MSAVILELSKSEVKYFSLKISVSCGELQNLQSVALNPCKCPHNRISEKSLCKQSQSIDTEQQIDSFIISCYTSLSWRSDHSFAKPYSRQSFIAKILIFSSIYVMAFIVYIIFSSNSCSSVRWDILITIRYSL